MLETGKMRRRPLTDKFCATAGFTLIELVIVASLIAVLAAVSTPLFKASYRNLELKNSAYNAANIIRYAEAGAIMEERPYKIVFDFDKGAYWVMIGSVEEPENNFKMAEGKFAGKFYLPKNCSFAGDNDEIIFLPNGRSTKTTISIMDKTKKRSFDIKTTGRAGQIEILDASEK